jgi:hypothetical protein
MRIVFSSGAVIAKVAYCSSGTAKQRSVHGGEGEQHVRILFKSACVDIELDERAGFRSK